MFRSWRWSWSVGWAALWPLASVLRLWQLGAAPLTYDAHLELMMAQRPLAEWWLAVINDVHPPAHLFLIWILAHLGLTHPFWLRLPSAVFSLIALYLFKRVGEAFGLSRRAVFIGAVLMAVLPFQIYYAQEARMYALLEMALLWAILAVRERQWVQLALALTLAIYTQNYGLIYFGVIAAWVIWRDVYTYLKLDGKRFNLRPFYPDELASLIAPLVAYAPWVLVLSTQMAEQKTDWWKTPTTPGSFLFVIYSWFWNDTFVGTLSVLAALLAFGLVMVALIRVLSAGNLDHKTLLYFAFAPALAAVAMEFFYRPILLPRALIASAAMLYLLIGWALDSLPRWETRLAAGLLAPVLFVGAVAITPVKIIRNSDSIDAGLWQYIQSHYKPGDIIYHGNLGSYVDANGRLLPHVPQILMPGEPGSLGMLNADGRQALGIDEISIGHAGMWKRAWFIWAGAPTISQAEEDAVNRILDSYPYTLIDHTQTDWYVGGVWLLERQRP